MIGKLTDLILLEINKNSVFHHTLKTLLPMLGFANQISTNKQEMEEGENLIGDTGNKACVPLTDEEQY